MQRFVQFKVEKDDTTITNLRAIESHIPSRGSGPIPAASVREHLVSGDAESTVSEHPIPASQSPVVSSFAIPPLVTSTSMAPTSVAPSSIVPPRAVSPPRAPAQAAPSITPFTRLNFPEWLWTTSTGFPVAAEGSVLASDGLAKPATSALSPATSSHAALIPKVQSSTAQVSLTSVAPAPTRSGPKSTAWFDPCAPSAAGSSRVVAHGKKSHGRLLNELMQRMGLTSVARQLWSEKQIQIFEKAKEELRCGRQIADILEALSWTNSVTSQHGQEKSTFLRANGLHNTKKDRWPQAIQTEFEELMGRQKHEKEQLDARMLDKFVLPQNLSTEVQHTRARGHPHSVDYHDDNAGLDFEPMDESNADYDLEYPPIEGAYAHSRSRDTESGPPFTQRHVPTGPRFVSNSNQPAFNATHDSATTLGGTVLSTDGASIPDEKSLDIMLTELRRKMQLEGVAMQFWSKREKRTWEKAKTKLQYGQHISEIRIPNAPSSEDLIDKQHARELKLWERKNKVYGQSREDWPDAQQKQFQVLLDRQRKQKQQRAAGLAQTTGAPQYNISKTHTLEEAGDSSASKQAGRDENSAVESRVHLPVMVCHDGSGYYAGQASNAAYKLAERHNMERAIQAPEQANDIGKLKNSDGQERSEISALLDRAKSPLLKDTKEKYSSDTTDESDGEQSIDVAHEIDQRRDLDRGSLEEANAAFWEQDDDFEGEAANIQSEKSEMAADLSSYDVPANTGQDGISLGPFGPYLGSGIAPGPIPRNDSGFPAKTVHFDEAVGQEMQSKTMMSQQTMAVKPSAHPAYKEEQRRHNREQVHWREQHGYAKNAKISDIHVTAWKAFTREQTSRLKLLAAAICDGSYNGSTIGVLSRVPGSVLGKRAHDTSTMETRSMKMARTQ